MKQVQKPKKPLIFYYVIVIVILLLLNWFLIPMFTPNHITEVDYGTFLTMVENREVSKVELQGETIYFTDKSETANYYETTTFEDPDLVNRLDEAGCEFGRVAEEQMNPILSFILSWVLPLLIFWGLGQLLTRQLMKKMGGGGGGNPFMQFGKSNAKVYVAVHDRNHIQRCGRRGRGEGSCCRRSSISCTIPESIRRWEQVCPKGALAGRPSGNRKDAACKGSGRRGERAVLLHFRLRVCGDVRRHGRVQGA